MLKRLMAVVVLTGIFCCGVATAAGPASTRVVEGILSWMRDTVSVYKSATLNEQATLAAFIASWLNVEVQRQTEEVERQQTNWMATQVVPLKLGNFGAFFAIAQDLALDQSKVLGKEKGAEAEIFAWAMKLLTRQTLIDKTGQLNQDALTVAIVVYFQIGSDLDAFMENTAGTNFRSYSEGLNLPRDAVKQLEAQMEQTPEALLVAQNFLNNNGLTIDGVPASIPGVSIIPTLGTLTGPFGGAIAFGDGGFPVVAGALDSHTLSTAGGLTAFSMGSGMDTGTNASPTVCSVTQCTDSTTVRWGAWGVGGSGSISGQPATMTANSQLHYLVGTATTPTQYATLTGVVAYLPVGGTTPTGIDGKIYSAAIGNINVNFTANTATLASYALSGNGLNTANYTFTNVPITIATAGNAKVLTGILTNTANNTLNTNGLFLGPAGSHLGMGFKTTDQAGTLAINQVQAFKR